MVFIRSSGTRARTRLTLTLQRMLVSRILSLELWTKEKRGNNEERSASVECQACE